MAHESTHAEPKSHASKGTFSFPPNDPAAPMAIRTWIAERIRLGLNKPFDKDIVDSEELAREIENDNPKPAWVDPQTIFTTNPAPEEPRPDVPPAWAPTPEDQSREHPTTRFQAPKHTEHSHSNKS